MPRIRSRALQAAKTTLHSAMRWPFAAKVATLIAQERDVVRSARAHALHGQALAASAGRVVRRGPFAGMVYAQADSVGSTLAPKLIGSYECELHPVLADIVGEHAAPYDLVIDIGAAEGYYAVGLARLLPNARVIAYEIDPRGRDLLRANAEANGVAGRIRACGVCTPQSMAALANDLEGAARVLIVSDCEGAEYAVLDGGRDPAVARLLGRADILLELHRDRGWIGASSPRDVWGERLGSTHTLTWIDVAGRDPACYPELAAIPFDQRQAILFERTEDAGWVFARAHGRFDRATTAGTMSDRRGVGANSLR